MLGQRLNVCELIFRGARMTRFQNSQRSKIIGRLRRKENRDSDGESI